MLLKKLTELNGISGNEDAVRDFIIEEAQRYADEIKVDAVGNVIALKKGRSSGKVMLSAHMDEVGFMITGIQDSGHLNFKPVGGIDEKILPGKRVVVGQKKINGVIAIKAIHLQDKEARKQNVKLKDMYIDIGCSKKEEAEKLVELGDAVAFNSQYTEFGKNIIKAKALDDRVGCCVLLESLKFQHEYDLYACFTVQEEVGLRGAQVAAYQVQPDIAFVVEGTTCSDVPGVKEQDYSTIMGDGAAITFMDRTCIPDRALVSFLYETAVTHNIKVQYKKTTTGGNDAGKIQTTAGGTKTASISVPCRYIHSPVSTMNRLDYEAVNQLVDTVLKVLDQKEIFTSLLTGEYKSERN